MLSQVRSRISQAPSFSATHRQSKSTTPVFSPVESNSLVQQYSKTMALNSSVTAELGARTILAGAKIDDPFLFPCVLDKTPCANGSGASFELFDHVMTELGLRYKLIAAEDNEKGYLDRSGQWRGLIGQLERGEIDMSASLLPVEPHLTAPNVVFSTPVAYYVRAFLIQKPDLTDEQATVSPWFLATTFTPLVWLCFLSTLIIYVCLAFVARTLAMAKRDREPWQYLSDSLIDVVRSPLGQMEPWPYVAPLRLTLNYLNIPIFVLMNFYTAYLTGTLMLPGQPAADLFDGGSNALSRLVHDGKLTLVEISNQSRRYDWPIMTSEPEDVIRAASVWNPPVLATDIYRAVEMVANNRSLVLRGSYDQLMHASTISCRTKVIEDHDSVPYWLAFAFRKDDPLKHVVSGVLASDRARVDRFVKGAYKKNVRTSQCEEDEMVKKPKFFALGLRELQHAYYVLCYGILAAVPLLVLERYSDRIGARVQRVASRFKGGGGDHQAQQQSTSRRRRSGRSTQGSSLVLGQLVDAAHRFAPNPHDDVLGARRISNVSVVQVHASNSASAYGTGFS